MRLWDIADSCNVFIYIILCYVLIDDSYKYDLLILKFIKLDNIICINDNTVVKQSHSEF
jgi:hypothetical protein